MKPSETRAALKLLLDVILQDNGACLEEEGVIAAITKATEAVKELRSPGLITDRAALLKHLQAHDQDALDFFKEARKAFGVTPEMVAYVAKPKKEDKQ